MCNLYIFVICVLIQSTLGFSVEGDGRSPSSLINKQQNNSTTSEPPVENDGAYKAEMLEEVLKLIVVMLRQDFSENEKAFSLFGIIKFFLKKTTANNEQLAHKVDDFWMTLYALAEFGEVPMNGLRSGNNKENKPLRVLIRKPEAQNEKLRLRYELPSLPNSYCTEALLNIAKIAHQAYKSLAENPICNLPGIPDLPTKIDTPTINPSISKIPLPDTWENLFSNNERPQFDDGQPPYYIINKNPKYLVPNLEIDEVEKIPVPSKEYEDLILNQPGKSPHLKQVLELDESYLYPNDVDQAYNSFFPQKKKFNYIKPPYVNPQETVPLVWYKNKPYLFGKKPLSIPLNPYYPDGKPVFLPDDLPFLSKIEQQTDNPSELAFEIPSKPKNSPVYPFDLEQLKNPENPSFDLNIENDDVNNYEIQLNPEILESKIPFPPRAPFSKNPNHAYELEPIEIKTDEASGFRDISVPNEDIFYGLNLNQKPMQPTYESIQKTISEIVPQDNNYLVPDTSLKLPEGQDLKVIGFIRDAIDVIEGVIPVVKFDAPTLYIIAKIKNILLNEDKDIEMEEYEAILDLYKKLINYVKQLNSYDQIIDHLDLSRVTNSPKLNTKKVVELTYLVKRPQPVVYYPYYYVKYRLPYSRFVVAAQKMLKEKPLRMDPNQYEEFLAQSKVVETSPDLKNYRKKDILGLVFNSGSLVDAKLIGENATLKEHLDALKEITSDLSAEEMLRLNTEASNKIKLFTAENNPHKNINERSSPAVSIKNGIYDVYSIPKVLKRNTMLDIANSDTKRNSDQPLTEASFDSNKLRSNILRGEHVGIPFSDHLNNVDPWQSPYPPLSSSLPEQEQISPVMYKLFDATIDTNLRGQSQPNIMNSGALIKIDEEKVTLNTGTDNEVHSINTSNPEIMINNVASVQNTESLDKEETSSVNQKLISNNDLNALWLNQQSISNMQKGVIIGSPENVEQASSQEKNKHLVYYGPINKDIENFILHPVKEEINKQYKGVEKKSTNQINKYNYDDTYSLPQNEINRDVSIKIQNTDMNDLLLNSGNSGKAINGYTVQKEIFKTNEMDNNPFISGSFGNQILQPSDIKQRLEQNDYQTGIKSQQSAENEMNVGNTGGKLVEKITSQQSISKIAPDQELFAQQLLPFTQSDKKINQQVISDQIIWTNPESISQIAISNRQNFKETESNSGLQLNEQESNIQQNYNLETSKQAGSNYQNYLQPGTYSDQIEKQWSVQKNELESNQLSGQKAIPSQQYPSQFGSYAVDKSAQATLNQQNLWSNLEQTGEKLPGQQNNRPWIYVKNPVTQQSYYSEIQDLEQSRISQENNLDTGSYSPNPYGDPTSSQNLLPGSTGNSGQQVISGGQTQSGSQIISINPQSGEQVIPSQQSSGQGKMIQQDIGIYGTIPSAVQQAISSQKNIYHDYSGQESIPSQQNYGSYGYSGQQLTPSQQNYLISSSFRGSSSQAVPVWQKYQQSGSQQIWLNPKSGQQVIPSQQSTGQGTMTQQSIGIYGANPSDIQQSIYKTNRGNYGQQTYAQATYIPFTSIVYKRPIVQSYYSSYPVFTRFTRPLQATYVG